MDLEPRTKVSLLLCGTATSISNLLPDKQDIIRYLRYHPCRLPVKRNLEHFTFPEGSFCDVIQRIRSVIRLVTTVQKQIFSNRNSSKESYTISRSNW